MLNQTSLAKKRAKRNLNRRRLRQQYKLLRFRSKVRNKKIRKMMIQGRREHLQKRQEEKEYIDSLKSEIEAGNEQ